jgi:pantetheine-phosphate adenylyltransferase
MRMDNNLKIAVYPGSFDPLTFGHIDIVGRALKIFDRVIISVAKNVRKNYMFSLNDRIEFLKEYFKDNNYVTIDTFDGLLVTYLKKNRYKNVIRGLRVLSDFEYEFQMAITNKQLYKDFEVVFLMSDIKYANLSSSLVKEIIELNGDISNFVPQVVRDRIIKIKKGGRRR